VEYRRDELNFRGAGGVFLGEHHGKPQSGIRPYAVIGTKDDSLPAEDIVVTRSSGNTFRRICLESLKVSHKSTTSRSRHLEGRKSTRLEINIRS
jgi:hypothetical protein